MLYHIIITTLNKAFINPISFSWAHCVHAEKKFAQEKRTKNAVAIEKKIATWKLYVKRSLTFQI